MSLLAQICIIYIGLYFQAGKNDPFITGSGVKWVCFCLITVLSLQFVLIFILHMRLEMMKATVEQHSFWFRVVSCCRVSDKRKFIKDNKVGFLVEGEITLTELEDRINTENAL